MTDLVSQLVGALEGMLRGTQEDCGRICMPSDAAVRAGFAALTAAKAGGWMAVPVDATQVMRDAGNKTLRTLATEPGMGIADRAFYVWGAMLAARPLPNPPKEQS